jgi:hypothetical protein
VTLNPYLIMSCPVARCSRAVSLALFLLKLGVAPAPAAWLTGKIIDADTGTPLAARLYLESAMGERWFVASASAQGRAVTYAKTNWINPRSIEFHTSLSAHGFQVELPPGTYTLTAERGKEYLPQVTTVTLGDKPLPIELKLKRWINLAELGWFSGDGHVHRSLADLPTLVLAEDLNVALPQTYWVTQAFHPPTRGDKNTEAEIPAQLLKADDTHVIWPRNTEYEIFSVAGKDHNLGAVFIVNHREPFTLGAPPLVAVAKEAHRQGALLDIDKCNWAWSLMLPPIMNLDLYELANNHLWRAEYAFTNFNVPAPAFMNLPDGGRNGGERDWMDYTLRSYYALLNCGFRMRPTAGTASGVHPVPLGFGRVYVHCPRGFTYDAWIKGLDEGRSFVTTGPMLLAEINGEVPGGKFTLQSGQPRRVKLTGTVTSEKPVAGVEVLVNGEVVGTIPLRGKPTNAGVFSAKFSERFTISGTSWVALRVWEPRDDGRLRFAHTAPSWFDDASQPLRPRRVEVDWLVERMQQQVEQNRGVLPPEAVAEFQQALEFYQRLQPEAR